MNSPRVAELIDVLPLEPHPEGGRFREVFRSVSTVMPSDGRPERSALTTIYFLLAAGEFSRLHRVQSDEVWHFYEGEALQLNWWDAEMGDRSSATLGPVAGSSSPVAIVPAGSWQSAVPLGQYALVGCTVGPGFDFADFAMLRDDAAAAEEFRRAQPDWAHLL